MLESKELQEFSKNRIPQYLYHYTSIETLALILKNRSIRFNSLDRMDDLQEKEANDIRNIGQFIYVSAWTSDQMESIPMWNMYASLNAGIRIQLQCNPFYIFNNTAQDLQKVAKMNVIDETQDKKKGSHTYYRVRHEGYNQSKGFKESNQIDITDKTPKDVIMEFEDA